MAERKAAEDEFNPRHRIVGAVILVALAVIFLPMLLSDRPPPPASIGPSDLPLPDTRIVVAPVSPGEKPAVPPAQVENGSPTAAPAPRRSTVVVPVEPVAPAATGEPKPSAVITPAAPAPGETKTTGTRAPETHPARSGAVPKPAAAEAGKWVVQAGAFSHLENARHLETRLRQKGYKVIFDPASPAPGKTVRVLVGPYPDADAAKTAAARLSSELGIQGMVRSR